MFIFIYCILSFLFIPRSLYLQYCKIYIIIQAIVTNLSGMFFVIEMFF